MLQALADFEAAWDVLTPENRARLVRALVRSVSVDEPTGNVTVTLAELELDDIGAERPGERQGNAEVAADAPAVPTASEARA